MARAATALRSLSSGSLIKVICSFFARLHGRARTDREGHLWDDLDAGLAEAYRAELRSVAIGPSGPSAEDLSAISRKKSTLPFELMLQIVRLFAGSAGMTIRRSVRSSAGSAPCSG